MAVKPIGSVKTECLLVFLQARGLKKQAIEDFIAQNKYLLAARLTSQRLFHELCPVKRSHRQRKYELLQALPLAEVGGSSGVFLQGS